MLKKWCCALKIQLDHRKKNKQKTFFFALNTENGTGREDCKQSVHTLPFLKRCIDRCHTSYPSFIFTLFFLSFIELTKTNSTGSTYTTTRNFIPLSKLQRLLMLTSHLTYPSLYILVAEATPYVRNHRCVLIGLQPLCQSRIEKKALRQVERISRAVQPLQQHTD